MDGAIQKVGGSHSYQKRILFIFSLTNFGSAFFVMVLPYSLYPIDQQDCKPAKKDSTMSSEFELVCQKEFYITLIASVYFLGMMIGSAIVSDLSDKYGRKKLWLYTSIFQVLSLLLSGLAFRVQILVVTSFIMGASALGQAITSIVLLGESVSPQKRNWYSGIELVSFSVGIIFVSIYLWIFENWRFCMILGSAFTLLGVVFCKKVFESPRYFYYNRGDETAAVLILNEIALVNNRVIQDPIIEPIQPSKITPKYNYCTLMKQRKIRTKFLVCMYLWFCISLIYYGISFLLSYDFGNMYLTGVILAIAQIVAALICSAQINNIGRKKTSIYLFLISGISCFYVFVHMSLGLQSAFFESILMFFFAMVRFCISAAFILIYIYTAELFPTTIRNRAFGGCNLFSRIGSTICPTIIYVMQGMNLDPTGLFCLLLIGAFGLSFVLEQTLGKPIPEDLDSLKENYGELREVEIVNAYDTQGIRLIGIFIFKIFQLQENLFFVS